MIIFIANDMGKQVDEHWITAKWKPKWLGQSNALISRNIAFYSSCWFKTCTTKLSLHSFSLRYRTLANEAPAKRYHFILLYSLTLDLFYLSITIVHYREKINRIVMIVHQINDNDTHNKRALYWINIASFKSTSKYTNVSVTCIPWIALIFFYMFHVFFPI